MRARALSACIGGALVVTTAIATGAGASSAHAVRSEDEALKRAGVSWVYFTSRGNAQRACRLQVEPNVAGVPCDQLPSYGQPIYCPAVQGGGSETKSKSLWRTPSEDVVKVKVKGKAGSIVVRAASKRSKMDGKASFRKVGLDWRIVSFQSQGRKFTPAGLIFTDGKDIREALWPSHC
jgi:hypothetical protein